MNLYTSSLSYLSSNYVDSNKYADQQQRCSIWLLACGRATHFSFLQCMILPCLFFLLLSSSLSSPLLHFPHPFSPYYNLMDFNRDCIKKAIDEGDHFSSMLYPFPFCFCFSLNLKIISVCLHYLIVTQWVLSPPNRIRSPTKGIEGEGGKEGRREGGKEGKSWRDKVRDEGSDDREVRGGEGQKHCLLTKIRNYRRMESAKKS